MIDLILSPFVPYILAGLAVLGAVFAVYRRGKSAGKQEIKDAVREERDELRQKFERIDSGPRDFDASVGRLRDRSRKG